MVSMELIKEWCDDIYTRKCLITIGLVVATAADVLWHNTATILLNLLIAILWVWEV